MEVHVGLGPGHIVFDGDTTPPKRGTAPPLFGPCLWWPNGWMDQHSTWYEVRRYASDQVTLCYMGSSSPPPKKKVTAPQFFGPCVLWPNGRPSRLLLSTCCILCVVLTDFCFNTCVMARCSGDHFRPVVLGRKWKNKIVHGRKIKS